MIPTHVSTTVLVLRLVKHRQVISHVAVQTTLLGISVKMVSCPMVDYVLFAPFDSHAYLFSLIRVFMIHTISKFNMMAKLFA